MPVWSLEWKKKLKPTKKHNKVMAVVSIKEPQCPLNRDELRNIFTFLSEAECVEICAYLELKEWESGAVLMQDGEPGDFMGFLVKGKLTVKKETSFPGKHILVAILEQGSMVGEISAVEPQLRNATVVATEKSRLLVLTHDNLNKLLETNNDLGAKLLKRIIHVLSVRLRKASDRLSWLL